MIPRSCALFVSFLSIIGPLTNIYLGDVSLSTGQTAFPAGVVFQMTMCDQAGNSCTLPITWRPTDPSEAHGRIAAGDPCSKVDFDWTAVVEEKVKIELELFGTGATFTLGFINIYLTQAGRLLRCPGADVVGDTGPTEGYAKSCQIFSYF